MLILLPNGDPRSVKKANSCYETSVARSPPGCAGLPPPGIGTDPSPSVNLNPWSREERFKGEKPGRWCPPRSWLRGEHFTQRVVFRGGKRTEKRPHRLGTEIAQGSARRHTRDPCHGLVGVGDDQLTFVTGSVPHLSSCPRPHWNWGLHYARPTGSVPGCPPGPATSASTSISWV